MSIINKEMFEEKSLFDMDWERRELEKIIDMKKDETCEKILEKFTTKMYEWSKDGATERDIKNLMSSFMQQIRQIERQ